MAHRRSGTVADPRRHQRPDELAALRALGARLRRERERTGLRREAVALQLGKTFSTVTAYERGAIMPPLDVLIDLAKLYGTTCGALLDEEVNASVA